MGVLTLQQAKEKIGEDNIRKIFEIQIYEKTYPVYSIEGYEHNLGKYNGCPDTWWLDYSVYHSDNDDEEPTMRELIPYIDKGVHRVCWRVDYEQHNSSKYKWEALIDQLIDDITGNDWYCIQGGSESELHEWEKVLLVAGLKCLKGEE